MQTGQITIQSGHALFARSHGEPARIRRLALLAFLIAQAGDGLLTYAGIKQFGVHIEANPLLAWYIDAFGPGAALATAKTFAVACVLPLHWRGMYRTIGVLTALYVAGAVLPWVRLLWPH
jgi:hypothetical protein